MKNENLVEDPKRRRLKPWLAALLTIPAWGLGLYYARQNKAAVRAAAASVLTGILVASSVLAYLSIFGPTKLTVFESNILPSEAISPLITCAVAIGVWVFVARRPLEIEAGSSGRMLGYAGIIVLPILVSAAIGLFTRSAIVQPLYTMSGAMKPTLEAGVHFAVDKTSFGYSRFSLAPFQGAFPPGRIFGQSPKRGDIVVYRPSKDQNNNYVSRVIGLPGDEVKNRLRGFTD